MNRIFQSSCALSPTPRKRRELLPSSPVDPGQMVVRHRFALVCMLVAGAFGTGFVSAGSRANVVRADPPAAPAAAPETACVDRQAMQANANLVEQVGDYRRRYETAREHAEAAVQAADEIAKAPPVRLVPSRDEWIRMARDGKIRIRLPCARWDQPSNFAFISAESERRQSADIAAGARAAASGLSDTELEAFAEAYARATTKTWAAIQTTCERDEKYRALLKRYARGEEAPIRMRIAVCVRAILSMDKPDVRKAIGYVAALRAAGAGIGRARTDEQRAIFALSSASATLFNELSMTIGRDRAVRAIDNGVGCIDETVFDVHDPAPEPEAAID